MVDTQVKSAQSKIDLCWNLTLVFAVGMVVSLLPDVSSAAAAPNAIQDVFVTWLTF